MHAFMRNDTLNKCKNFDHVDHFDYVDQFDQTRLDADQLVT